jgi:hypothetical protein
MRTAYLTLIGCCLVLASGCGPAHGFEPVDLTPPDQRAVLQVEVADANEARLLEEQLAVDIVRQEGATLFLYDAPGLRGRLEAAGYAPAEASADQVHHRVVRVERRGEEAALDGLGVQVINRERTHWVVRGSLGQLRALEQRGYTLGAIEGDEPRPRHIRIVVPDASAVAAVGAMGVDIYGHLQEADGYVIHGGAFDFQIDELRDRGYTVTVVSVGPEGGEA